MTLRPKAEGYKPTDETALITEPELTSDYKRSKFRAEAVAMELFRKKALPIVVVNPSAPVGPRDGGTS